MRAFLSHSSVDKNIVIAVHDSLAKDSTWLDRAEIEWGDLFLEKIAEGVAVATDFILFWSANAAKSEWVRLEVNMAFIQMLRHKAIRLRVVTLDKTPLPLYLQPFHSFSVAGESTPVESILKKLSPLLREHIRSTRSRFVNRHGEMERIEAAVDDPEFFAVWMFGFTGVGKMSLVREALHRIFEGADLVHVEVSQGTGFVELALTLNALARNETLAESLSQDEIERQIRLSIETVAKDGRLLVVSNVQHWLSEDGTPQGPLSLLLSIATGLEPFARRPVFFTSTRRPSLDATQFKRVTLLNIQGLSDEHIAVLVRNWHFSIHGRDLLAEDANRIAPKLFGHPVAARLVAGLLGDHGVAYLEKYPQELIALRRDLARLLLQDLQLGSSAERLMEILALAGVGLSAAIIAANGFSDEEFQQAVEQCARAGLITADVTIKIHPLFQEFFWHRLHRGDYQQQARQLANTLKKHLSTVDKASQEFVSLLPATFRLLALSGDLTQAMALRRDLSGELEATAIVLYNRRNYLLADEYINQVLDDNPGNWRMRLYRARIRIRQEDWSEADAILASMLQERPNDIGVLHAMGWRQLRQNHLQQALDIFTRVISRREHTASLRDAAECLHKMQRNQEALQLLKRAKENESENPFILDLESRILEDLNQLEPAYESALLASARDPLNATFHNRLGVIRTKQGKPELSVVHFQKAIEIDSDWFSPINSLASAFLETSRTLDAETVLPLLLEKVRTPNDRALAEHTKARIAFAKNDLDASEKILNREIAASRNLVPNLGLLTQVELALFDQNIAQFPTLASVALTSAEQSLATIERLDPSNKFVETLRAKIAERTPKK